MKASDGYIFQAVIIQISVRFGPMFPDNNTVHYLTQSETQIMRSVELITLQKNTADLRSFHGSFALREKPTGKVKAILVR